MSTSKLPRSQPREITDENELQKLLELRHAVHTSLSEWVFELDNGGTLSLQARADYLHAIYYPPGWEEK